MFFRFFGGSQTLEEYPMMIAMLSFFFMECMGVITYFSHKFGDIEQRFEKALIKELRKEVSNNYRLQEIQDMLASLD